MGDEVTEMEWEIVGLASADLKRMSRLTGCQMALDRSFFEQAVWWWRPLLGILGPKAHAIDVPSRERRGFFPTTVFEELRAYESGGGLRDILSGWFTCELAARLHGAAATYPAFTIVHARGGLDGGSSLHLARVPEAEIDLRKTDTELLREHRALLRRLRQDRREQAPFPVDDKFLKSSYLSEHTFAMIELIDRRMSLGEHVENDEWANVNKAVRLRKNHFFRAKVFS